MEKNQSKSEFYGWKNLALLFFIYMVSIGLVNYGYSAIFPAMIKAMGWGRGQASIAQTVNMLIAAVMAPATAWVLNRFGGKRALAVGLLFLLAGLFLLVFFVDQLLSWILVWGVLMAAGLSFAGLLSVQTVIMFWFDFRRTLAFGIAMSGGAVGGFLAQPTYTWLMQKSGTWRAGWAAAGCFAIVGLVATRFIKNRPEEMGQFPDGLSPKDAETLIKSGSQLGRTYRTTETWTLNQALKTPTLYMIMILMIAHIMGVFLIISHGVLHLMDRGLSQMSAASAVGFIILGSGLARIPMGWLGDRLAPRWLAAAAMVTMMVGLFGIWWAPSFKIVVLFGLGFGFSYGTSLVMMGAVIGNYYGVEAFASINGFLMPFMVVSAALVPTGAGFIADYYGNYNLAFAVVALILGLGAISASLMAPPKISK